MIKIQNPGSEHIFCYTLEQFSKSINSVVGRHIALKYRMKSGINRVLFITVTAKGVIEDTYTGKAFEIEELWKLHLM